MARPRVLVLREFCAPNIKYWRAQRGLTQEDLVAKTGIQLRSLQYFEEAQRMPDWEMLGIIAGGLEVNESDLIVPRPWEPQPPGRPRGGAGGEGATPTPYPRRRGRRGRG